MTKLCRFLCRGPEQLHHLRNPVGNSLASCPSLVPLYEHYVSKLQTLILGVSLLMIRSARKTKMSINLKTRCLGKDGPQLPMLGLGLMGLSCEPNRLLLPTSNVRKLSVPHQHSMASPRLTRSVSLFWTAPTHWDVYTGTLQRCTVTAKSCLADGSNELGRERK